MKPSQIQEADQLNHVTLNGYIGLAVTLLFTQLLLSCCIIVLVLLFPCYCMVVLVLLLHCSCAVVLLLRSDTSSNIYKLSDVICL